MHPSDIAPASPLAKGTLLSKGRYIIGHVLKRGETKIIYFGADTTERTGVAICEWSPARAHRDRHLVETSPEARADKERLTEQTRRLACISHIGLPRVFDSFVENQTTYIVYEYLEGASLDDWLHQTGTIPTNVIIKIIREALKPLGALHQAGLLHLNLTPEHLFLTADKRVVLLGFSALATLEPLRLPPRAATTASPYLAPELYTPCPIVGPQTDLYALAAILVRAIAGNPPRSVPERLAGSEVHMGHGKAHRGFESFLNQAMALKTNERFMSIQRFDSAMSASLLTPSEASATESMTQCSYCAEDIPVDVTICPHCDEQIRAEEEQPPEIEEGQIAEAHKALAQSVESERECPFCAELIKHQDFICQHCGSQLDEQHAQQPMTVPSHSGVTQQTQQAFLSHKNLVPAIASFIVPGTGQLINGQIYKGIMTIIGTTTFVGFYLFSLTIMSHSVPDFEAREAFATAQAICFTGGIGIYASIVFTSTKDACKRK